MNKTLLIAASLMLAGSIFAQSTNFTAGNLVVAAVDITITGSGATGGVHLKEFNLTPSSAAVSQVDFISSGAGRFVYPWNTNSGLNLNFTGGFFTINGYDTDSGVTGASSSSSVLVPRLIAKIPVSGSISFVSNTNLNNGTTPRSVVTDGTNFWSAGAGASGTAGGIQYVLPDGTNSPISLNPDTFNIRHIGVYNGDLYYTTAGGGLNGLHKYTGMPTTATNSAQIVATGTAPASSPYDFAFSDASTVYITDDRTFANGGGILKYTFDGSVWNYQYTINTALGTGCRAIVHLGGSDFAVITNETVSGTTATVPSKLYRVTDGGSDALSTAVLLQTAPSNQNYRGVRLISGAPSSQNLTGTLALGDTGGLFAFNRSIAYEVKQGVTTIASGTISASASNTALNISVPAANTGSAQLILNGSSFLKRVVAINLTGSNQAIGTATMQNGDVNNSGEVDAVDIDNVIANFGFLGDDVTDVDVNGEVDAVDIDIVIANFGGLDD